jgi:hypothetical protein
VFASSHRAHRVAVKEVTRARPVTHGGSIGTVLAPPPHVRDRSGDGVSVETSEARNKSNRPLRPALTLNCLPVQSEVCPTPFVS